MTKFRKRLGENTSLCGGHKHGHSTNAVHLGSCFREPSLHVGPLKSNLQSFWKRRYVMQEAMFTICFTVSPYNLCKTFFFPPIQSMPVFFKRIKLFWGQTLALCVYYLSIIVSIIINLNACCRHKRTVCSSCYYS